MHMNLNQRIFTARKDAKLTQEELAEATGKTRSAVAQWESGEIRPRHATLVAIARATGKDLRWLESNIDQDNLFGLMAVGEVAAGLWKEGSIEYKAEMHPVAPDPRYPSQAQRLYRVSGTSINKIATDGAYLHAVDILDAGLQPAPGDLVVARRMQHDLTEYTAKRLIAVGGQSVLQPESWDPQWQEPIRLGGDESTQVEITDIVIAVWTPVLRKSSV